MSGSLLQEVADERRSGVRYAASGSLDMAEVEQGDSPARTIRGMELLNLSGGGMAFLTSTRVEPGGKIMAMVGGESDTGDPAGKLFLEILECQEEREGKFMVRCRLMGGAIPARLIYDRGKGRFLI